MKLTAKLAYSQLKINRSRTFWTLIGVILSTALIAVVCSFGASGDALLADFLGGDYEKHRGTLILLLMIPIGLLSGVIIAMSVAVISNAFRVSAGERTAQFGMLKSVGATKKQIISSVMYESIFLSIVGIPIGIVLGLFLAFIGIEISNHMLGELNSLVNIMLNEIIIVFDFVIAWQALLGAALLSFATVLLSAWLPARKAAKISAIDSIRGAGEVKIEAKAVRTSPIIEKIFGFEGTLAAKSMKRNKRNFRVTVASLTIGIILFVNLGSISRQLNVMQSMLSISAGATVIVDYSSNREQLTDERTGREMVRVIAPIDSDFANDITNRLREFEDTRIFGLGEDMVTYDAIISNGTLTEEAKQIFSEKEELEENKVSATLLTVDFENYKKLCEKAGVSVGENILLNQYTYNDNGKAVNIVPFQREEKHIQFVAGDGNILDIPIHGMLTKEDIPKEFIGPNVNVAQVIVPKGDMRGYMWYAEPEDIKGFIEFATRTMHEMFPEIEQGKYMEQGYTTRVYKTQDYMKIMNIPIEMGTVFAYSFVVLLALIGLTNIISTMSTNVQVRSREFAVLQSVGMTPEGLKRMLRLESILCSGKSLAIGLPIALLLTYFINLPIRSKFPIPYELPWFSILLSVVIVFLITGITMQHALRQLRGENIIETIRTEG